MQLPFFLLTLLASSTLVVEANVISRHKAIRVAALARSDAQVLTQTEVQEAEVVMEKNSTAITTSATPRRRRRRSTKRTNCPAPAPVSSSISNSTKDASTDVKKPSPPSPSSSAPVSHPPAGGCFPSAGFKTPANTDGLDVNSWWCDANTEYAFLGVSYEVTPCQSLDQLKREFLDVRNSFKGRYIRMYGACDRKGFYDDVVEAAWEAGVGVHALVWFGWANPNAWQSRRDALLSTLHSNPKAKFVTRAVQFGSEPLFDSALSPPDLLAQVKSMQGSLKGMKIPVTVSEMSYGYSQRKGQGSFDVLKQIDVVDAHVLPFFSTSASTGANAWPNVESEIKFYQDNAHGKKLYFSQNGWPSMTYPGVSPNSPNAQSNVANEEAYFKLLDSKCSYFKSAPNGGIGWFAHIYSDSQEPGYGLYGTNGKLKFQFNPRSTC